MNSLEINEICWWAEVHRLARGHGFEVILPELPSQGRQLYANGRRSGAEKTAAIELVAGLGSWQECLVWISEWGVWPSREDWPRFYAWRGALKERRSLEMAPGHQFSQDEADLLAELITLVMENAWDAHVLCSRQGRADGLRGWISHDEWYELLG